MSTHRALTFHVRVRLFDSSHRWAAGHGGLASTARRPGRPWGCPSWRLLQHRNQSKTVVTNKWLSLSIKKKCKENGINPSITEIPLLRDVKTLTVAPLVGVAGCFASKDCRGEKVTKWMPQFRCGLGCQQQVPMHTQMESTAPADMIRCMQDKRGQFPSTTVQTSI